MLYIIYYIPGRNPASHGGLGDPKGARPPPLAWTVGGAQYS